MTAGARLVVDDPVIRSMLTASLQAGHRVTTADSGSQALDLVRGEASTSCCSTC
jgi:CheY-like chemotaxis protein